MQPVAPSQLDFRAWKVTQKPETLNDYHTFIARHLKPAPPLLDMIYNRHRPKKDCQYIQFKLPDPTLMAKATTRIAVAPAVTAIRSCDRLSSDFGLSRLIC